MNEEKKLSLTLRVLSYFQLVIGGYSIFAYLQFIFNSKAAQELYATQIEGTARIGLGVISIPTVTENIVSLISWVITVIGLTLVLKKKKMGINLYFAGPFIRIGLMLIVTGFSWLVIGPTISYLILPIIMGYNLRKQMDLFE